MGKKLSKQVDNTVGKGEIARYEQFLLFPQCFQKACFPGASKGVIVWEWVNALQKVTIHVSPADIARYIERRTCEHNATGHYSLWV